MKLGYLLLAVLLVSFGIVLFGDKGLFSAYKAMIKKEKLKQEITTLEENNAKLRKKIKLIKSDDSFLEDIIREKLSLVREKEILVKFQEKTTE